MDSDAHLQLLRAAADVLVTDCLDVCGQSNVIVVQPSPAGRHVGGRPAWLGFVNDETAVGEVAEWIAAGGPGLARLPATLELHAIAPPGRP